ncbi:DUF3021 domain-containing protein [Anaerolentibacter hominis]|uniref:DUF3021 domain-containing protein n=1 Tax=Anaerolentibacter hominis TaxID=3079009 RepID=UPI0031B87173
MKKKLFMRCLVGAPVGLAISTIITILISITVGDGRYYPVVPELIADCGGELNAVILQAVCSLLYGAAWSGAALIWETESWSMLRQTVTHLIICSAATFPVAYFMRWMRHNAAGIFLYFGIFFAIYLGIWIGQYFATKRRIGRMNEKVAENFSQDR